MAALMSRLGGGIAAGGPWIAFREWMMSWPIGWTALEPLGTAKYQEWLRWHGGS
jgi:hypothetical protein